MDDLPRALLSVASTAVRKESSPPPPPPCFDLRKPPQLVGTCSGNVVPPTRMALDCSLMINRRRLIVNRRRLVFNRRRLVANRPTLLQIFDLPAPLHAIFEQTRGLGVPHADGPSLWEVQSVLVDAIDYRSQTYGEHATLKVPGSIPRIGIVEIYTQSRDPNVAVVRWLC